MVDFAQQEGMEIDKVARNVERAGNCGMMSDPMLARGHALDQKATPHRCGPSRNDDLFVPIRDTLDRNVAQDRPFLVRQSVSAPEDKLQVT